MLYELHDLTRHALFAPMNLAGRIGQSMLQPARHLPAPFAPFTGAARVYAAGFGMLERVTRHYDKQPFGLPVAEDVVWQRPFCNLLRFAPARAGAPRVLIFAPMSGHHATLLRGTVESLIGEHEVFITDWLDAKQVPLSEGRFGLDEYIDYTMAIMEHVAGDGAFDVLAICQPCVPVLAAVSLMSEDGSAALPRSLVLMSGPIDPGAAETEVTRFALKHDLRWFERKVIHRVPSRYPGRFRRVYPGMVQLAGFMSTQIDRHMKQHLDLFRHLSAMDGDAAERIVEFYDEYLAVLDLTAEFYLETIDRVFQRRDLAHGRFTWRGRPVDPGAIERVRLLTVEGEKDDICAPGQTIAAHALLRNLPESMKANHVQDGVGHYGVFSGSRYRKGILPVLQRTFAGG
ncbi:polyhydroxyalkanoate depolymerase [Azospirillum halopraeferens]|uniref:polyhydroxyalkanoate depolymerase n=1 Tax=Azospirillum halopraeferens TaxID=34010 RepID=UPI00041FC779|nr:polyhydroxyalkanoate depolymerase [Azospirillum halopraeferens]